MSSVNQIVGGKFQDSLGNVAANGTIEFELSQDCTVNTSTLVCGGRKMTISLNSSGSIPSSPTYSVWNNDQLTPSTSLYLVRVYSAQGQLIWGPNAVQVLSTTSPFDIGAWIP